MSTFGVKGGNKFDKVLADLSKKIGKGKGVKVGFFADAVYPDGTHVAQAAFWAEYGTKTAPPRSFFRQMIAAKSAQWGGAFAQSMKASGGDSKQALGVLGEGISGQLTSSIVELTAPALSPITVMLRGMRRNKPGLKVTGATVGEAAARVAAGKTNYGASAKPLIDSGLMQRSTDYEVIEQ